MGIVIEILADDQVPVRFIPPRSTAVPSDEALGIPRSKCPHCGKRYKGLHGLETHLARMKGRGGHP